MAYVIGIDQSTQGTKVLLFDGNGNIMYRADRPHRQIINDRGWVSHDMEEVYANLIDGVRELLEQTGVDDKRLPLSVSATSGRPRWPGEKMENPWLRRWCGSAAGQRA